MLVAISLSLFLVAMKAWCMPGWSFICLSNTIWLFLFIIIRGHKRKESHWQGSSLLSSCKIKGYYLWYGTHLASNNISTKILTLWILVNIQQVNSRGLNYVAVRVTAAPPSPLLTIIIGNSSIFLLVDDGLVFALEGALLGRSQEIWACHSGEFSLWNLWSTGW